MLRLYGLGSENFWVDEVMQVRRATPPVIDFMGGLFFIEGGGLDPSPVSMLVHHILLQVTTSEALLRLPSAIFATADVLAAFFLARLLLGERVALVTSLLLAFSPLHIWYAQEMRWYALWSLLATLSFLFLARSWRHGGARRWVLYLGTLVASAFTFVLTFFVMACQGVSALWLGSSKSGSLTRTTRPVLITQVLVVLVSIPLFWMGLSAAAEGSSRGSLGTPRAVNLVSIPYAFFAYSAGFSVGPTVRDLHFFPGTRAIVRDHPVVLAYLIVALVGCVGLWRLAGRTPARHLVIPWLLGLPILVFLGDIYTGLVFNVRYTLPALTAWTIAVGAGAELLWTKIGQRGTWLRWSVPAVLALLTGYSLVNYYFDPRYDKEDTRGALSQVRALRSSDATVAVLGQISAAAHYYGSDLSPIEFLECEEDTDGAWTYWNRSLGEQPAELKGSTLTQASELWFVVGRDWSRIADRCLAALATTHRVADTLDFTGTKVYRLQAGNP